MHKTKHFMVTNTVYFVFTAFVTIFATKINTFQMIEKLKNLYGEEGIVTKENILEILKLKNPMTTEVSLRKQIMQMSRKGLLQSVKQGVYTLNIKPVYHFEPNETLIKIRRIFTKKYPEISYCIWSSDSLNNFMVHQPFKKLIIFEVEKELLEPTFHLFSDLNFNAFILPDEKTMEQFVIGKENPIIIKPLINKSPTIKVKNCNVPAIEKILVDTYCDKEIFSFYQGSELQNIFNYSDKSVAINYSKLLSYAHGRSRRTEITNFLLNQTNINPEKFQK